MKRTLKEKFNINSFTGLFDQLSLPLAITDEKFYLIYCNKQFCKSLSSPKKKLLTGQLLDIIDNSGAKINVKSIRQSIRKSKYWNGYLSYKKGKLVADINLAISLLTYDKQSKANYYLVTFINKDSYSTNKINIEYHFKDIFNHLSIGLYKTTPGGKVISANPALVKMLGFKSFAALSKRNLNKKGFHKNYSRKKFLKEIEKKGEVNNYESAWLRMDGSLGYVREYAKAIKNENGKTLYYEGIIEDITEKKLSEKYLIQSEESYRGLFNSVAEAIYIQDKQGRFLDVNDGAVEMYGYKRNEFIGRTPEFLSAPGKNDLKKLAVSIKNAFKGINQEFEFWGKKKSGEVFPKNVRLFKGKYYGMDVIIALAKDITMQQLSQEALKASEESYKALIETSPDPIYVLKDKRLQLVNSAWLKLFGYKKEEVINKNFDVMQIVAPQSIPFIKSRYAMKDHNKVRSSRYEFQAITKKGKILDIEANVSKIVWKGETVYQGVYRDITDTKKTYIQLRSKDQLLEGVAKLAVTLVTGTDLEKSIHDALAILGISTNVSRVYIFENHFDSSEKQMLMSQRYEWTNGKVSVEIDNPELQNISYKEVFPGWYEILSSGKVIKSFVKDFPENIRLLMESQDIVSLLLVPIFVQGNYWGFIGFDDCETERDWSEAEISTLYVAGNTIGNVIARRIIEEELRESEERYRLLVNLSPDAIGVYSENKIIFVNDAAVKLLGGKSEKDILGHSPMQFVHPDSKELVLDRVKRMMNGEFVPVVEEKFIQLNGNVIDVEVAAMPLLYNNKKSIQLIIRDISQRKQSEEALRLSEKKYRNIFENVQDIFYQADINGLITEVSPSVQRYIDSSPDELIGKSITEFYYDPEERNKLMQLLREKGEVVDYEVRLKTKSGKIIYTSVNSRLIKNEKGEMVGVEGTLRDVTERRNALEQIKKLSLAIEESPSSVVITNPEGIIEYVNPKFTEVSGYPPDEVKGKKTNLQKSGYMSESFYAELWKTILSGKIWYGEFLNKKKNGELFWESASISPIKDSNGRITNFVSVKQDITEKKKQEEERENNRKELIIAKEKAETANKLKSEFLAQMSHEIRSPLNVILNFSNLIKEELTSTKDENLSHYFTSLDNAGKRIIRTVDMILNMSELQTGTYELQKVPIVLYKKILEPLYREYKNEAVSKGLELRLTKKSDNDEIFGDEYSISQIFANLIDNAIKYTNSGFVEIELGGCNQNIIVSVIDTGIGITKEYIPYIFDPFSQEDRGYTRKFDGNGLGLALIKKYCELNDAIIDVESEKGKGTKMSVIFRQ
ncbi:MAG: PAS domain S-box protein [Bacteroidota bacterium]